MGDSTVTDDVDERHTYGYGRALPSDCDADEVGHTHCFVLSCFSVSMTNIRLAMGANETAIHDMIMSFFWWKDLFVGYTVILGVSIFVQYLPR